MELNIRINLCVRTYVHKRNDNMFVLFDERVKC